MDGESYLISVEEKAGVRFSMVVEGWAEWNPAMTNAKWVDRADRSRPTRAALGEGWPRCSRRPSAPRSLGGGGGCAGFIARRKADSAGM